MTPSKTQSLLALGIIVLLALFVVVGFRANQQALKTAPRAQVAGTPNVSCTSSADCTAYAVANGMCKAVTGCAAKCDTSTGTCVFATTSTGTSTGTTTGTGTGTTSSGTGTTTGTGTGTSTGANTGVATPAPSCPSGIKEMVTKACTGGATGVQVEGIVCWNDNGDTTRDENEYLPINSECISAAASTTATSRSASDIIADARAKGEAFCAGKTSPACSGVTPGVSVIPTVSIPTTPYPANCNTKGKGDANCDGKIDLVDFNLWLPEFIGTSPTKYGDFNIDSTVNLTDFEIWRTTFTSASFR